MLEKYEWICNEKQFFGQPNTAFDFAANDMKDVSRRLSKLQETKEKLGKNVNMRAMNMLGKAEEKVIYLVSLWGYFPLCVLPELGDLRNAL